MPLPSLVEITNSTFIVCPEIWSQSFKCSEAVLQRKALDSQLHDPRGTFGWNPKHLDKDIPQLQEEEQKYFYCQNRWSSTAHVTCQMQMGKKLMC